MEKKKTHKVHVETPFHKERLTVGNNDMLFRRGHNQCINIEMAYTRCIVINCLVRSSKVSGFYTSAF